MISIYRYNTRVREVVWMVQFTIHRHWILMIAHDHNVHNDDFKMFQVSYDTNFPGLCRSDALPCPSIV